MTPAVLAVALAASILAPVDATTSPCPAELPATTTCYEGQDANGAFYTIAVPQAWNRSLVVHAHGGPDLGAPTPERSRDDLARWNVMVREGYAWIGSSYRRGGYGTRMAAEDTENVRKLFTQRFGRPRKTILHGQSWGGNVAAKAVEIYRGYDAALLTSGVLAGGSRGYDYRVDLKAVYEYYCGKHDPQTSAELRKKLQECTGYQTPVRTEVQQRNLDDILGVTKVPESALASHLNFATFTFRDIVHTRLGDRNPFSNKGVRYSGSHDDLKLNATIARFDADPKARRDLSYDSDITGTARIPILTVHAIGDPTAFVEHEAAYRASMRGRDNLVQTFTTEAEHSALSDAEYASAIRALAQWERTGRKPTPRGIAAACPAADAKYGTGCFFDPAYSPGSYASRVNPRPGGLHWPALTAAQQRKWERQGDVGIAP
ncbi:alpha/beta hydrolase family protein [Lentzea tibetensis]|uniref:alpha/beta hydrolase family protein n=1 Tax=Lentzea tibetensis TaxID=2591470 RepID=UPI001C9A0D67|nr:DUF6351 family protein [Lentzea tibetensis]